MENVYNGSTSFLLLGLLEMEGFQHVYSILSIVAYTFIVLVSSMIIFVILTEESFHQPMYILICTIILNGMFGSSSFFPKLIIDLLSSTTKVSRTGCLLQVLCVITYTTFEVSSLTVMAYDRYLAVCHPLHYVYLMTNEKAMKFIGGAFIFSFTLVLTAVLLSARLPFCGTRIKNIFCDNMSLVILSCVDASVNTLYGTVSTTLFLVLTLLMIAYSYLRIFMVCLKISKEACQKAIHTLVTHLMNFSIFLIGFFFIFIRYRLGNVNLPTVMHVVLSVTILVFPPLLNPIIYGIRTKALNVKLLRLFQKTFGIHP